MEGQELKRLNSRNLTHSSQNAIMRHPRFMSPYQLRLTSEVPKKFTKAHLIGNRGNSVEAPFITYRIGGETVLMMVGITA